MLGSKIQGRVFGYCRCSTMMQVEDGVSLDKQKSDIFKWCDLKGVPVYKYEVDEGISGTLLKEREGLMAILYDLEEGDVLVVSALDRLSRSIMNLLQIADYIHTKKCNFVIIQENIDTTTPMGQFTFHLMGALAELEVSQTRVRVTTALQHMKTQNRALGPPCYGWQKRNQAQGSGLIEVPEEQKVIQRIKTLRFPTEGNPMAYLAIAELLNKEGVTPPRRAKKWYNTAIKTIAHRNKVNTKGRYDDKNSDTSTNEI